jgi:type III secretion YscU/HrpY family protein
MADKNDGGDKTELPTPKKLRDAREKGDVAKSKDVGASLVTLLWFVMIAFASGYICLQISEFSQLVLNSATSSTFKESLPVIGQAAALVTLKIFALTLIPVAAFATFAEFAQIGPIMTGEKMKPSFDKLNPVEGLKRMFGMDGLVELLKTLIKSLLIVFISYGVIKTAMGEAGEIIRLASWSPVGGPGGAAATQTLDLVYTLTLRLFGLTVLVFIFVAILDRVYTQHSFIKKMKMSMRDIKQEYKQDEGDPQIKGMRRQMHEEWANQSAVGSTRNSAALLVNPTHLAIAIDYDPDTCPVPVIAAKGEGALAAAMRAEAEKFEVPIIRNIGTARRLWSRGEIGEIIPEEMFDAIAEVILWAKKAKQGEAPMWNDMNEGTPDIAILHEDIAMH